MPCSPSLQQICFSLVTYTEQKRALISVRTFHKFREYTLTSLCQILLRNCNRTLKTVSQRCFQQFRYRRYYEMAAVDLKLRRSGPGPARSNLQFFTGSHWLTLTSPRETPQGQGWQKHLLTMPNTLRADLSYLPCCTPKTNEKDNVYR